MPKSSELKRQNFNVTPEEEAELIRLKEALGAASVKDALLRASRMVVTLAQEVQEGRRIYLADARGRQTRLLLPDVERNQAGSWMFLAARSHPWKRQLFVKGRRLTAANVWNDALTNHRTPEETAENWDLPLDAVDEIFRYCEANRELIAMEADEEARFMQEHGLPTTGPAAR